MLRVARGLEFAYLSSEEINCSKLTEHLEEPEGPGTLKEVSSSSEEDSLIAEK
jgi:hypothetical protein